MVQAVLSNHRAIATSSEPWVQLLAAPYVHSDQFSAPFNWGRTSDAVGTLQSEVDLLQLAQDRVRSVANDYYESFNEDGSVAYFLDKTPRYYCMLSNLFEAYAEAKFLVLKRHPVSVLASIYKTWLKHKRFEKVYDYTTDFIDGQRLMDEFLLSKGESERVMEVNYEDLLAAPTPAFDSIFKWLDLEFSEALLDYSSNGTYQGKYGDPTGVQRGSVVERAPDLGKRYKDHFPDRRWTRLASGLADYSKSKGYIGSESKEWERSRMTSEFRRFERMSKMRAMQKPNPRACMLFLKDRLMASLGL
jgi:hypothetical protein